MKLGIRSEILNLDLDDLQRIAGDMILFRGMAYMSRVHDISVSPTGGLVGRVSGTREYKVEVEVDGEGLVYGYCSCPFEGEVCKHVVALILAAKENESGGEEAASCGSRPPVLEEILESKSKEELVACILNLVKVIPQLEKNIIEIEQLRIGETQPLVDDLWDRIEQLSDNDYHDDYWADEDPTSDLQFVGQKLQQLLASGHPDEVVMLGTQLWKESNLILESIYDEGEYSGDLWECMKTVFEAVPVSSLSRPDQLLYLVDVLLSDEYSTLRSMQGILDSDEFTGDDWLAVVEALHERLQVHKGQRIVTEKGVSLRSNVVEILVKACQRCGLQERAIQILMREVKALHCYDLLAELLIAEGRLEEARSWCRIGYDSGKGNGAGGSFRLLDKLREIAVAEGRGKLAMAYSVEKFFCKPLPAGYLELREMTEEAGDWPDIRLAILEFLNSGKRPYNSRWPLPAVEVLYFPQPLKRHLPNTDVLVDIAILEERFSDAIELYHGAKASCEGEWLGLKVADAAAARHPDFALEIWHNVAMSEIAQVKPSAYERATVFLRKMHAVYQEQDDLQNWRALLAGIRTEHKRKRRLMAELDLLPDAGRNTL